jgi:DNA polymerase III sliding clamp (beta) subunit (PCNA family)
MKVNRKQLVESLELVYPAVGISAFVPEFQNFRFYNNKVQTTDGVMKIETVLPDEMNLRCSVPAAPFLHLLKSLDEDEIELSLDKNELSVITDKIEGTFATAPIDKFNLVVIPVGATHSIYHESLIDGFKFCRYGISKDQTLGPLCGVRLDAKSLFSSLNVHYL